MFGLDLKYIVIIILAILIVLSGVKKLFKLAITLAILAAIYYLYINFLA